MQIAQGLHQSETYETGISSIDSVDVVVSRIFHEEKH